MIAEDDALAKDCVELVKVRGPLAVSELAALTKQDAYEIRKALRRAADAGLVEVRGMARAARWQVPGEKREAAASETVAPRAAKSKPAAKPAKKSNGNGHPKTNGHAAKSGASSLFEQLAKQMVAEVLALVPDVEKIVLRGKRDSISSRHLRALLAGGMGRGESPRRWWKAVRLVCKTAVGEPLPDFRQLDIWTRVTQPTSFPPPPRNSRAKREGVSHAG